MNRIARIVRRQAAAQPTNTALVDSDVTLTWARLYERSCIVANALVAAGVGPGDRVAIIDKNGSVFFEILFGCALCGAVPVPISWRLSVTELAATLNDSQAKIIFVGPDFTEVCGKLENDLAVKPTFVALGGAAPGSRWTHWTMWAVGATTDPQIELGDNPTLIQLYTSGTTGLPKGVLVDQRNVSCLFDKVLGAWSHRADDTSLVCMPLFHMGGIGYALVGMEAGCRSIIVREFDPATVVGQIEKEKVSIAFFVPAMLQMMSAVPGAAERKFSLRRILYAGAPITRQNLTNAMAAFRCDFVQLYGMSETTGAFSQLEGVDHALEGERSHRLASAGRPYPWVEVKIVDPASGEGRAVGEVGEIWTRSDLSCSGYWRNDVETSKLYGAEGWLRTGDAGYIDKDGFIFLTDRIKDMIISGGENVYPIEVERVLSSHPDVADVAVIGVPSEKWGETVKAVVVRKSGTNVDADELQKYARARLAAFKCPTSVDFVVALPRSATGKVLKKDLRAPYWKDKQRQIN